MTHGVIGSGTTAVVRERFRTPEMNIFDHLRIVFKYRWMILVICSLAGMITGVVCYLSPPTYTAMVSIVPPLELFQGKTTGFGMGLLGVGEAALLRTVMDVTNISDTYVAILESRVVLDALVQEFDLADAYDVGGSAARARAWLRRNTSIRVSEQHIVHITVKDADRKRAADLANAYVEGLDQQNKRLSAGQATSKRVFLETRLKEVKQKLSKIDSLPSEEAKVQEMLYELLIRECEIAKIEEAKSLPTIQVLDPAVPPEMRNARGTIRKAALAGIVALVCTIFLAFGREYVAEYRRHVSVSASEISHPCRSEGRAAPGEEYDGNGSSVSEERTQSSERRPQATGIAGQR